MANISAIITAVDNPKNGWYKARIATNATIEVSAVSLKGTEFTLGQEVGVIQYRDWNASPEFGFTELGSPQSIVYVTDQNKNSVMKQNPANTALAYIANLIGNSKMLYHPATVTAINGSNLNVSDRVTGQSLSLGTTNVNARDYNVGDGCLISLTTDNVIGYWQTAPEFNSQKIPWLFIYRMPFTTDFQIGAQAKDSTGAFPIYPIIRSTVIPGTDPVMDYAASISSSTSNDDDYVYSQLNYRHTFGPETDVKYIKWHKTTLAWEFITAGEMPPTGYHLAYAGKDAEGVDKPFKPWQQTATEMQQSDTVSPLTWYNIITLSLFQEERFPYQDYQYRAEV